MRGAAVALMAEGHHNVWAVKASPVAGAKTYVQPMGLVEKVVAAQTAGSGEPGGMRGVGENLPQGLSQSLGPGMPSQGVPPQGERPQGLITPERAAAMAEQKALAELAGRCVAGDGDAWEELARTQHRKIYGICYRFTGSPTEAEDMTQDVFIKVFRNLASFDAAKGSFNTWLTTLTRNMLVDNYRRARMERVTDSLNETYDGEEDGPSKLDKLADNGPSQEEHVAGLQLRAEIQAALLQVSPELRQAVILRDLEDMDYKDIAEAMGVPVGTVKSRISRGRSELAKLLKRKEGQVM